MSLQVKVDRLNIANRFADPHSQRHQYRSDKHKHETIVPLSSNHLTGHVFKQLQFSSTHEIQPESRQVGTA